MKFRLDFKNDLILENLVWTIQLFDNFLKIHWGLPQIVVLFGQKTFMKEYILSTKLFKFEIFAILTYLSSYSALFILKENNWWPIPPESLNMF